MQGESALSGFIREIQPGKFTVIFFSCLIIRLSGINFIVEGSQPNQFSLMIDICSVFISAFADTYSRENRSCIRFEFFPVAKVLRMCCKAEI